MNIRLKAGAFPKLLADLSHSNQFLKVFAFGSLLLSLLSTALVFVAFTRKPIVIAMTESADILKQGALPKPDTEVRQAVLAYIERRYNWTSQNVDERLALARIFVSATSVREYTQGTDAVRRFSKEKAVSQRAFARDITVDLRRGTVKVTGDRITEIQGVRAAGPLNLELGIQGGPRTVENPWGVYILNEVDR